MGLAFGLCDPNIGALMIRVGFWGPVYCKDNKETPPKNIGNYLNPFFSLGFTVIESRECGLGCGFPVSAGLPAWPSY